MITLTTKRLQSKLVTLADLKVAIAPGDSDDVFLGSLIDRVTSYIEMKCRRKFGREVVTETFNGNSRTTLAISNLPVMNLGALTLSGVTVATTEYEIFKDGSSGLIFMETGWAENKPTARGIEVIPLLQPGDDDYSLIYTYGFLLPGDNLITGVSITSNISGTFTLASGKWPLFVDGDKVTFTGFSDSGLNDEFTIASRDTDLQITVDETPSATEVGSGIAFDCQTLPEELEQVAIQLVNSWFKGRKRDTAKKSEKIGDWAATFGAVESPYIKEILNHYRVIF